MSENVGEAAPAAWAAPTPDSGFIDSGAGSSRMTMLSQNAVRNRKNMALPLVFHGVFTAVEVTLAEPLEGEVGSVPWILRMLEASCLRLFLKFERFSSLRKCRRRHSAFVRSREPARVFLKASCDCHRAAAVWQPTIHHSRRIHPRKRLRVTLGPCVRARGRHP